MAIQMVAPADPKRDAAAAILAETAHTWHTVTLRKPWGAFKTGDAGLQTPNGYRCNAVFCQCPDYAVRGAICKHIRAVRILDARNVTPKPKNEYAELYPTCRANGCQEDPEPHEPYCFRHVLVDVL